jgi:hypothetical protein
LSTAIALAVTSTILPSKAGSGLMNPLIFARL